MKIVLAILSGVVLHMLYLDSIFTYEMHRADKCFVENDEVNPKKSQECLERLNSAGMYYKGKYFDIASLFKYKKIVPTWTMQ